MTLLLFALGAALLAIGSIRINNFEAEGPMVRAAGLVLTMPLIATLFFGFMITMMSDGENTAGIIGLVEVLITIGSLTVAYTLLFRSTDALKSLFPQNNTDNKSQSNRARNNLPKIMTVTQAALYLGITENAVIELIDQGKVPASKLTTGYQISRTVLDEYLAQDSETL